VSSPISVRRTLLGRKLYQVAGQRDPVGAELLPVRKLLIDCASC
jgi:hypothetical protein